jgi:hypothetical protein
VVSTSKPDSVANLMFNTQTPDFKVFTCPPSTLQIAGVAEVNSSSSEVDNGIFMDAEELVLLIAFSF